MQQGTTSENAARLRVAQGRVVSCGEMALRAQSRGRPQSLGEAKDLLGANCMSEFNDLMSLSEETSGRRTSIEEANQQFVLAAKELIRSGEPVQPVVTNASRRPSAAIARHEVPASCNGSVKKGLKAYNAGNFEAALCHWLPKARSGDAAAQNNMGLLFERGLTTRTPQSDVEAAGWFLLAAQQGLSIAMRNLATVQTRMGYHDAARSWVQSADATDQQNQVIRDQQAALGMAALVSGVVCALGGCPAPTPYPPQALRDGGDVTGLPGTGRVSLFDDHAADSRRVGLSSDQRSAPNIRICADGSYVAGTCNLAPDGTYTGGLPRLAPDGTYVGGTPRLAPNGSYVGGSGRTIMCPDGSYVSGERCRLTPSGTYVGQ